MESLCWRGKKKYIGVRCGDCWAIRMKPTHWFMVQAGRGGFGFFRSFGTTSLTGQRRQCLRGSAPPPMQSGHASGGTRGLTARPRWEEHIQANCGPPQWLIKKSFSPRSPSLFLKSYSIPRAWCMIDGVWNNFCLYQNPSNGKWVPGGRRQILGDPQCRFLVSTSAIYVCRRTPEAAALEAQACPQIADNKGTSKEWPEGMDPCQCTAFWEFRGNN